MNEKYQVNEEDGISIITLKKNLNLSEMETVLSFILENVHNKRRLWIATECINFSTDEIRKMADFGKMKWPKNSRVAYVASDDLSFGLIKMFEVFSEEDDFQTKVFRKKEDGMDWLRSWENN